MMMFWHSYSPPIWDIMDMTTEQDNDEQNYAESAWA